MKTLVIFGGARKKCNTMRMVNFLLDNIEGEKEIIYSYDLKVSPCMNVDIA